MMEVLKKMPNWKAPVPDNGQGHWLKSLTPYLTNYWRICRTV